MVFALAGIAIVSAVGLMSSSMWGSNYMEHRLNASAIANSRIEHLRAVSFADLDTMTEDAVQVNEHGLVSSAGAYQRTTTIGALYKGTRMITVTVTSGWKYDAPDLQVDMATIIMDPDILDD